MKTLQIFKRMSVFSIRLWLLLFVIMIFTQGFFACKSDDSSPQTLSQTSNERIRNLIETNHWQQVEKPKDVSKIVFLKDVNKATQFFQNLKVKSSIQTPKSTQKNDDMVLSYGFFTFLNGEKATFNFQTSPEGKGEILGIDIDQSKLTFAQKSNYVEIQKWGIVALPKDEELLEQPKEQQYFLVPVVVYKAFLENNGWSSVQFLTAPEQANFEGEGGSWEGFYVNAMPPALVSENTSLTKTLIPTKSNKSNKKFNFKF